VSSAKSIYGPQDLDRMSSKGVQVTVLGSSFLYPRLEGVEVEEVKARGSDRRKASPSFPDA